MDEWFTTSRLLGGLFFAVIGVGYHVLKALDEVRAQLRATRSLLAELHDKTMDGHRLLSSIEDVRMEIRHIQWIAEKATGFSVDRLADEKRQQSDEDFKKFWSERFPDVPFPDAGDKTEGKQ